MDASTKQWFRCGQKFGEIREIWSSSPIRCFLSCEEKQKVDSLFDNLEYQLYVKLAFKNNDAFKFYIYLEEVKERILDIYKKLLD